MTRAFAVVLLDFGHRAERSNDVVVPFHFQFIDGTCPSIAQQGVYLLFCGHGTERGHVFSGNGKRLIERFLDDPTVLSDVQACEMQAKQAQLELESANLLNEQSIGVLPYPRGDFLQFLIQVSNRQHGTVRMKHGVLDAVLQLIQARADMLEGDASAQVPNFPAVTAQQSQTQPLSHIPGRLRIDKRIAIPVPSWPKANGNEPFAQRLCTWVVQRLGHFRVQFRRRMVEYILQVPGLAHSLIVGGWRLRIEEWCQAQLMKQFPNAHQVIFLHGLGQVGDDGEGIARIELRRVSGQYDPYRVFTQDGFQVFFLAVASDALHETLQGFDPTEVI